MNLLSATDDFAKRSLAKLGGALEQLRYLCGLRQKDGRYEHWGMNRVYGEQATQSTVHEAHVESYMDCLRTPLGALEQQAERSADKQKLSQVDYLQEVSAAGEQAEFSEKAGGSRRHFNSALFALRKLAAAKLARARKSSTHPDA